MHEACTTGAYVRVGGSGGGGDLADEVGGKDAGDGWRVNQAPDPPPSVPAVANYKQSIASAQRQLAFAIPIEVEQSNERRRRLRDRAQGGLRDVGFVPGSISRERFYAFHLLQSHHRHAAQPFRRSGEHPTRISCVVRHGGRLECAPRRCG